MKATTVNLYVALLLWIAQAGATDLALPPAVIAKESSSDSPSAEMLEFLGEWQSGQGQWLDPSLLQDMSLDGDRKVSNVQTQTRP